MLRSSNMNVRPEVPHAQHAMNVTIANLCCHFRPWGQFCTSEGLYILCTEGNDAVLPSNDHKRDVEGKQHIKF